METTIIILTIIGIVIFFGGAYFMGNMVLNSFHADLQTRITHTAFGILCWAMIGIVGLICWGIFELVKLIFS